MKARALILTIGTTVALVAPAAHAAGGRNALNCDYVTTHALPAGKTAPNPFSAQVQRNLQTVVLGEWAATSRPNRTSCGGKPSTGAPSLSPNHSQVLRNSAL